MSVSLWWDQNATKTESTSSLSRPGLNQPARREIFKQILKFTRMTHDSALMNTSHHPLPQHCTSRCRDNPRVRTALDAPDPFQSLPVSHSLASAVKLRYNYVTTLSKPARKAVASSSTFAQLGVLFRLLAFHLLVILGLGGAPVTLPLQHMADDHAKQAQQEEHRHQDEGHVVWLGLQRSLLPSPRRLTGWGSEWEDRLWIIFDI